MIGEGPSLIEILPSRMQGALDGELKPGEKPVVALKGSPQSAVAATPDRLLTLNEGTGVMDDVAVQSYPLSEVTDIALNEAGAGPALTWNVRRQADPVVFSVPPYDTAKFRMVANAVRRLLTQSFGSSASSGAAAASRCPKCQSPLPVDAAFCPACGLQTRDVCWECGRPLDTEWRFCPSCGGDVLEPGVIPCPSCRASAAREHAYCPKCGTALRPTCDECDRILRRSWRYCPDCGAPVSGDSGGASQGSPGRSGSAAASQAASQRGPSTPFPEPGDVQPARSSAEAEALNQRGIAAYERERFDEAIDLFRRALALDPQNAAFHCNLAVACGENGLDDEAYSEYQRTLSLDPANVTALVNLGYLYSERERYEEARDCWERAVRAAPDTPEAAEARANLQNLEQL
jgi:predicted amidophosphoribosyltransferase